VEVPRPRAQRERTPGAVQQCIDRQLGGVPDALTAPTAGESSHRSTIRLLRDGSDVDQIDESPQRLVRPRVGGEQDRVMVRGGRQDPGDAQASRLGRIEELVHWRRPHAVHPM
jgi:hypothetical protein